MKHDDTRNDRVRAILRRGDPASGERLGPEDVARMRREVLSGVARRPAMPIVVWATTVSVMVLAVVLALNKGFPRTVRSTAVVESPAVTDPPVRPVRVIHFVTEGGTRVIWTLDPEFVLEPPTPGDS